MAGAWEEHVMDLTTRPAVVLPARATIADVELVARHLSGGRTDGALLKGSLERLGVSGSWCGNAIAAAARRALVAAAAPQSVADTLLTQLRPGPRPLTGGGAGGLQPTDYTYGRFKITVWDTPRDDWPAGPVQVKLDDGTLIGTATGANLPRYAEVVGIWLTWGLSRYQSWGFPDPAGYLPAGMTHFEIEIEELPTDLAAGAYQGGMVISNTLSDAMLGWAPLHELFHDEQYCYISQARALQLLQQPGQLEIFWQEGTAETAAALLQPARNAVAIHWSSYLATCQAGGGFWTGMAPIFNQDYDSIVLWKYLLEQAQLPAPVLVVTPTEPDREGVALSDIWALPGTEQSYALSTLADAEAAVAPVGRNFVDVMKSGPQGLDVYDNETLYGNWLAALYLTSRNPERRFTYQEQGSGPGGMTNLPALLPAISFPPTDDLTTYTTTLQPWSYVHRVFDCGDPAFFSGAKGLNFTFTADAGSKVLFQILLLDNNLGVVDIVRSRDLKLSRNIFSRGGRVQEIVACLAALDNSGPVKLSLASSTIPAAPDMQITRWNSPAGCEYQVDPAASPWDWQTPDIWLEDVYGLVQAGKLPPANNYKGSRLHVTVRNNGPVTATNVSVRVTCQPISPYPDDTAWQPMLGSDGKPLVLALGDVAANSTRIKTVPVQRPGDGAWSIRCQIDCAGDSSPDNNAAVSSFDALLSWPPPFGRKIPQARVKLVWPTVQPPGIPPCDPFVNVRWGDLKAGESAKATVVGSSMELELDPIGLASTLSSPSDSGSGPARFATAALALDHVLAQPVTVTAVFGGRVAGGFTLRLPPSRLLPKG